jgi:anhydro-N-acetylmuramic acid kinase
MSGTSLDGIDGVVVDFDGSGGAPGLRILAHARSDFAAPRRIELAALNRSGDDEIHRAALAANSLARDYAALVDTLLASASLGRDRIVAIGCHGQTIRHRPGEFDGIGYSVQLTAPALLAELCGIDVVADFRSRDVAAGGQGAPLVPAFHRAIFGRVKKTVAVLNLGGIANLTVLGGAGETIGFDCGPANALLDLWCERSSGLPFDAAARPRRVATSTSAFSTPSSPSPTSASRHQRARASTSSTRAGWTGDSTRPTHAPGCVLRMSRRRWRSSPRASSPTPAVAMPPPPSSSSSAAGGARNADLMRRLDDALAPMPVVASGARGLPEEQVEAAAFAWLARAFLARGPRQRPRSHRRGGSARARCAVPGALNLRFSARLARAWPDKKAASRRLLCGPEKFRRKSSIRNRRSSSAFGFLMTNWAPWRSSL